MNKRLESSLKILKFIRHNYRDIKAGKFAYTKLSQLRIEVQALNNLFVWLGISFLALALISQYFKEYVGVLIFFVLCMPFMFMAFFLMHIIDNYLKYPSMEIANDLFNIISIKSTSFDVDDVGYNKLKKNFEDIKTNLMEIQMNVQILEINKMCNRFYEMIDNLSRLITLSDKTTFKNIERSLMLLTTSFKSRKVKNIIHGYSKFDTDIRRIYKNYFNEEIPTNQADSISSIKYIWAFISAKKAEVVFRNLILFLILLLLISALFTGKLPFGLAI